MRHQNSAAAELPRRDGTSRWVRVKLALAPLVSRTVLLSRDQSVRSVAAAVIRETDRCRCPAPGPLKGAPRRQVTPFRGGTGAALVGQSSHDFTALDGVDRRLTGLH